MKVKERGSERGVDHSLVHFLLRGNGPSYGRTPIPVEKMTLESPADMVIYRSRLNAKINRNFKVFTATDFPGRHHPTHPG